MTISIDQPLEKSPFISPLSITAPYSMANININEITRAYRANASQKAIPINIVVRTIPAVSGCRAIPSTDFPTK